MNDQGILQFQDGTTGIRSWTPTTTTTAHNDSTATGGWSLLLLLLTLWTTAVSIVIIEVARTPSPLRRKTVVVVGGAWRPTFATTAATTTVRLGRCRAGNGQGPLSVNNAPTTHKRATRKPTHRKTEQCNDVSELGSTSIVRLGPTSSQKSILGSIQSPHLANGMGHSGCDCRCCCSG